MILSILLVAVVTQNPIAVNEFPFASLPSAALWPKAIACETGDDTLAVSQGGSWHRLIHQDMLDTSQGCLRVSVAGSYVPATCPSTPPTVLTGTRTINFGSVAAGNDTSDTVTVTGAAVGDAVHCSPDGSLPSGATISFAYVSAADTVTFILGNLNLLAAVDPASRTYRCTISRP